MKVQWFWLNLLGALAFSGCATQRSHESERQADGESFNSQFSLAAQNQNPGLYERIAEQRGWLPSYKRGDDILRELVAMRPEQLAKVNISAYRDETVTLVGMTAPPGGTDDLLEARGFYLRVINPKGKELRFRGAFWSEVMLRGKILQVLAENKIIVLQVDENDWHVLQTG